MEVQDSVQGYQALCAEVREEEAATLVRTCKMLRLPQKTVATALFSFFTAKRDIRLEPDDIVLHSACINIACRMCETHRPTERIFEYASYQHALETSAELKTMYITCINRTELDVCVALDFDFEMPDFYGELESACRRLGLPASYSRRCWVFLNDLVTTPISVFFGVQEIVFGCILAEFAAAERSGEAPEDAPVVSQFMQRVCAADGPCDLSSPALEFVALEICSMYERDG